jgi:putative thiamine transport system ATP-binding protein
MSEHGTAINGLVLHQVSLAINGRVLFENVNITAAPSEIVTLMGASGSGKSSLIAYICGSLDPALVATGEVMLNGVNVLPLPIEKRRIGVLFQDDLLFAHMSVGENLAFAIPQGISKTERQAHVHAALAEVELDGFAARDPATLSGGQKARVSLIRALLAQPHAMLLDEPFSKLDAVMRDRIRSLTFRTIKARNIPAILVTHDEKDATERVVML